VERMISYYLAPTSFFKGGERAREKDTDSVVKLPLLIYN